MYNDMREANYDIHQMETVGPGEKCVDIQLAVEMLHYATVTNAYDIAILLRYVLFTDDRFTFQLMPFSIQFVFSIAVIRTLSRPWFVQGMSAYTVDPRLISI